MTSLHKLLLLLVLCTMPVLLQAQAPLLPVLHKGLWGFADTTGKRLCPAKYQGVSIHYYNRFFIVEQDGLYGVIDNQFNYLVEPKQKLVRVLAENHLFIQQDGKGGIYDLSRARFLDIPADSVHRFFGCFKVYNDSLCGVLSAGNTWVVPPQYTDVALFSAGSGSIVQRLDDGRARTDYLYLVAKGNLLGLCRAGGKEVLPCVHEGIAYVCDRAIAFKKGQYWGLMTLGGKVLAQAEWSDIRLLNEFIVELRGKGKAALANVVQQEIILHGNYDKIFLKPTDQALPSAQRDPGVIVARDGLLGFIDYSSKELVAPAFDKLMVLNDSCLTTIKDGKYGLVGLFDSARVPCEYDEVIDLPRNIDQPLSFVLLRKGAKVGLASSAGHFLMPARFDNFCLPSTHFIKTVQDKKYGLYTMNGQPLLPPKYDDIRLDGRFAITRQGNRYGLVTVSQTVCEPICNQVVVGDQVAKLYLDKAIEVVEFTDSLTVSDRYIYDNVTSYKVGTTAYFADTFKVYMGFIRQKEKHRYEWVYDFRNEYWQLYDRVLDKDIAEYTSAEVRSDYYFMWPSPLPITYLGVSDNGKQIELECGLTRAVEPKVLKVAGCRLYTDRQISSMKVYSHYKEWRDTTLNKTCDTIVQSLEQLTPWRINSIHGPLSSLEFSTEGNYVLYSGYRPAVACVDINIQKDMPFWSIKGSQFRLLKGMRTYNMNGGKWGVCERYSSLYDVPSFYALQNSMLRDKVLVAGVDTSLIKAQPMRLYNKGYKDVAPFCTATDSLLLYSEGRLKKGLVDTAGKVRIQVMYQNVQLPTEGKVAVCMQGRWGFVDLQQQQVCPLRYDSVRPYTQGCAAVELAGQWGFVDSLGNELLKPQFDAVWPFSKGHALVQAGDRYGFVDRKGRFVVRLVLKEAYPFAGDYVKVKADRYGYLKSDGSWLVQPFEPTDSAFLRIYRITRNAEGYGVADTSGSIIWGPQKARISGIYPPHVAVIKQNKKYGLVNFKTGEKLVRPTNERIMNMNQGLVVFKKDKRYGYLDAQGNVAIADKFKRVRNFASHRAAYYHKGKWGYLDRAGKAAIKPQFAECTDFENGRAVVVQGDEVFCIDTTGQRLFYVDAHEPPGLPQKQLPWVKPQGPGALQFTANAFWQQGDNGRWALLTAAGARKLPYRYNGVAEVGAAFAIVETFHSRGVANYEGDDLLPPNFDEVVPYAPGVLQVWKDGKMGYYRTNGQVLLELAD